MSQNKRKINKRAAIRLASFLGLAVSLLCLALGWLFHRGFALPSWLVPILYSKAGAIGGADGPTAIFVTGEPNPFAAAGLFCLTLFSAFGIYCTEGKN